MFEDVFFGFVGFASHRRRRPRLHRVKKDILFGKGMMICDCFANDLSKWRMDAISLEKIRGKRVRGKK